MKSLSPYPLLARGLGYVFIELDHPELEYQL